MSTSSILNIDPLVIISVLGGFIGMVVGLVTIWAQIKKSRRDQKNDIEASNLQSENRLKAFFKLELKVVDTKIDGITARVERIEDNINGGGGRRKP